MKWNCDYFLGVSNYWLIVINIRFCNWILIIFWIVWELFFNGVRRFLMYSIIGSKQHIVSGHINVLSFVLWQKQIDTGTVRRLIVMPSHFLFFLPSFWTWLILLPIMKWVIFLPNVEIIRLGWYFWFSVQMKYII